MILVERGKAMTIQCTTTGHPAWSCRARIGVAVAVICLTLATSLGANDRTVEFRFSPPHPVSFTETMTLTKKVYMDEQLIDSSRSEQATKYTISRTENGYSVVTKPKKTSTPRASKDLNALLTSIFADAIRTYDLDNEGSLVRVRGADVAVKKVRKTLPDELWQLATGLFGTTDPAVVLLDSLETRRMGRPWYLDSETGRSFGDGQLLYGRIDGESVMTMKFSDVDDAYYSVLDARGNTLVDFDRDKGWGILGAAWAEDRSDLIVCWGASPVRDSEENETEEQMRALEEALEELRGTISKDD